MKVRSCLFVLLACSTTSTNVAAADKPKTATPNTNAAKATAPTTNPSPAAVPTADQAANSAALAVVTKNAPSISGTGMVRPGTGTGSVGGSAKIVGGAIGGSGVQIKHP